MDKTAENATHRLRCAHALGRSRFEYYMRCHVLKRMSSGQLKLLVFGDRYWKARSDKKRIRYVDAWRVTKAKEKPDGKKGKEKIHHSHP